MDVERAFLSKIVQTQQADKAVSRGIEPDHFADNECREIYETVVDHLRQYRAAPSLDAVRADHPDFRLEVSSDTLEFLMDKFVQDVKRRLAINLGRAYRDAIDDPQRVAEIELIALEMARNLTEVVPSPRISRFSDMEDRIREYDRRVAEGDVYGLLTGINTFDELTLGIQPHEMVIVMAFLGVGKSTLMQWIFYQVYLQGKTPLMMSLEMDAQTLLRRFDAMATQVRYWALKAMDLGSADREKWELMAERADADRHEKDILIVDDVRGCTVDKVMAEAIRWKPDMIGVDYIGLMKAPRSYDGKGWEKLQYVSRELKGNARVLGIPHLVAAQGNRETGRGNVSIDNVGEFYGLARDCDILIGMNVDEEMEARNEMEVLLLKNRDGKKARSLMHWDLDRMDIRERGFAPAREGANDASSD